MRSASEMLSGFEGLYALGEDQMDETHLEFLNLCASTAAASGQEFADQFQHLLEHTEAHFSWEEELMKEINHGAFAEHRADHQRILGDMSRFCERAKAGRGMMAKAWVSDSLLAWFDIHAKTMDSALAADIKSAAS